MLVKLPFPEQKETQDVLWFQGYEYLTCGACEKMMQLPASSFRIFEHSENGKTEKCYVVYCPLCREMNEVNQDDIRNTTPSDFFAEHNNNNNNTAVSDDAPANPFAAFTRKDNEGLSLFGNAINNQNPKESFSLFTSGSNCTPSLRPNRTLTDPLVDNYESGKVYQATLRAMQFVR